MSDNMAYWNRLKNPPTNALKKIEAGRLKGKSDINPQWRYEVMTEVFGICGIGWKYDIENIWTEPAPDNQVFTFAKVLLFVKLGEQWSDAIPGLGGSMMIEMERNGLHANDEAYKMAITDALGTAMKMLGVAAEVYRGNYDGSKYGKQSEPVKPPTGNQSENTKDKEYHMRTAAALRAIFGDDIKRGLDAVEDMTAFTGKDGEIVKGIRDFRKLSGKRLEILCHNLEKEVERITKDGSAQG